MCKDLLREDNTLNQDKPDTDIRLMNKAQKRIFKQAIRLQEFSAHSAILQSDPFYQEAYQKLHALVNELEELNQMQYQNKGKMAFDKQKSREQLESHCFQVACLLKSYGNFYHFVPFACLKGYGKNQLYKYSGNNLLSSSVSLQKIIEEYPEESEKAMVGDFWEQELKNSIATFDKLLDDPKWRKKELKATGESIQDRLKQYQNLLNHVIVPYVKGKYASTDSDLLFDVENVLRYEKIPRRKISLVGTIKDDRGVPVHRPRLTIDNKKTMVKRGAKGNFFIKNLSAGRHSLVFTCKNYESVTKEVMIVKDKLCRLDVVMKMKTIRNF
ncbi:hypothetical protein [Marinifilum sp.]|uniref:hypothetical protein n=1 Tax=Marinifilum sp. TaxID=2033137 RepID=UPI003BAB6A5B